MSHYSRLLPFYCILFNAFYIILSSFVYISIYFCTLKAQTNIALNNMFPFSNRNFLLKCNTLDHI